MNQHFEHNHQYFSQQQAGVEDNSTQTKDREQNQGEAIAIIGMACRFPGANDYEQFWLNLEAGVNSITEIPPQRWDVNKYYSPHPQERNKTISKWAGLIQDSDQFDAQFFAISPREAKTLDPQQRLMLELSWSCLEDAGYSPSQLSGSQVGVFIGACNYDSVLLLNQNQENIEGHSGTGSWGCMIANRISYFLNFRGLSVSVDTACSSSLVALHLGVNALKNSECDVVLVGGISVFNTPTVFIQMSQLGMLSPTGQCQTFDQDADGYVRGEGAGIILLKPLAKAIKDQDHIYAVIKGSAVNHGGKSRTLSSPNIYAQAQVVRAAYTNANVAPNTVSYIEVHGTGTPLGDPIEINALKRGFRQLHQQYKLPESAKPYCGLGTVKTNIGHSEGAAGIAGLIKVLLAMKHKKLPKILNFKQLNPRIELEDSPFYIVDENQEWQLLKAESEEIIPRRAGISSFGVGGVNAHVVLEEAPNPEIQKAEIEEHYEHILTLSAKNEKALEELVKKYQGYLQSNQEESIADICFTANTGRTHFEKRCFFVAESNVELQKQLQTFVKINPRNGQKTGKGEKPKIAFLFTGEISDFVNIGWQLYQTLPTFRKTLEQCEEVLQPYLEIPLLEILYPTVETLYPTSLLAVFAIEYALAQLWQSWGIKPDGVMGYGVGKYVAATVAGVFSLEAGLKLMATTERLMQQFPSGAEISPNLDSPNRKHQLGELQTVAQEITYNQPGIPIISNITGQQETDKIATPEYWLNDFWQPVHFSTGIQTLHRAGYQLFLEIGVSPIQPENVEVWLPTLSLLKDDWRQMLLNLGQLYVKGVNVDWSGFYRDYPCHKVALPTYPFQRQYYWLESSENEQPKDVKNNASQIVEFLNQIDINSLAQDFNIDEQLTEPEKKLLPKLLNILINRYQNGYQSSEQNTGIFQQLDKTPERERFQLTVDYLQGVVAQLLGLNPSQIPDLQLGFFDLGLDYSMMLELGDLLQKSFGCSVTVTTLSEHFNIQKLAQYLIESVFRIERYNETETTNSTVVKDEIESLTVEAIANAIQEEAIAIAINEELKEIQLILNQEI
ncbi:polyketide synthase type 1 [Planktothrix serta PCC 8927]|uniref:Polyketide synthase type 1 n=1 Tax=Planktothrix serta PCC 8927 TaxID=671068 RepID=A0A7Z9BUK5_9CYAN|nr:type I polyketide synthase [Planktothrix serta]VXD21210.1 polyketide synthase type 1 [Planktothrix serta PCC 8927]